ncbi:MAG TPA: CDP-alcohol phosphatidyltransferase family protein [Longimicrobium sp.]
MHASQRHGGGGWLAAVRGYLSTPANLLTGLRLAAIPVLWILALDGRDQALGYGLAAAFASDLIDGPLARRLGQTSEIGSRTDSIADHMLATSTVVWLFLLRPAFFQDHAALLLGWSAIALFTLGVAWVRFRRFVDLHLYSAKVTVFCTYTMAIGLLATGHFYEWHFRIAFAVAMFAALESLAILLTWKDPDRHGGSIFLKR